MGFIQIIRYETDHPDEIEALEKQMGDSGEPMPFTMLIKTRDRDNPRAYVMIVEFPSYEAAMANSNAPQTQEFAGKMGALSAGPPQFYNLDVLNRM